MHDSCTNWDTLLSVHAKIEVLQAEKVQKKARKSFKKTKNF